MPDKVLIFGKDAWPYTRAARAAFAKDKDDRQVDYYDVVKETRHLETLLEYSKGTRKVPIIVEGETVTIGFEGDTWGIWFFRLEAGYEWRLTNVECGMWNTECGLESCESSKYQKIPYYFIDALSAKSSG